MRSNLSSDLWIIVAGAVFLALWIYGARGAASRWAIGAQGETRGDRAHLRFRAAA